MSIEDEFRILGILFTPAPTVHVKLKIVEQNMKTLKLSETDALARQEKYEETIRTTSGTLKV
jgi:hypothetical protein